MYSHTHRHSLWHIGGAALRGVDHDRLALNVHLPAFAGRGGLGPGLHIGASVEALDAVRGGAGALDLSVLADLRLALAGPSSARH